jgi:putative protease
VGEVLSTKEGWAEVETKNRFAVGDTLEIIHPPGNRAIVLEQMKSLEGESIQVASGSPLRVWIPLEGPAEGACMRPHERDQPSDPPPHLSPLRGLLWT